MHGAISAALRWHSRRFAAIRARANSAHWRAAGGSCCSSGCGFETKAMNQITCLGTPATRLQSHQERRGLVAHRQTTPRRCPRPPLACLRWRERSQLASAQLARPALQTCAAHVCAAHEHVRSVVAALAHAADEQVQQRMPWSMPVRRPCSAASAEAAALMCPCVSATSSCQCASTGSSQHALNLLAPRAIACQASFA